MAFQAFPRNEQAIVEDGRSSTTHSLKQGTTILRVMPAYNNKGFWYKKIHEYYFRFGNTHIFMPSPRDFNQTDPIWDYADEVFASGDTEKIEQVKKFRPRETYLVNAYIFSEPNQQKPYDKIVALKVPKSVQRQLKRLDTDASTGYGDITDLEKGVNITIHREGTTKETTKYDTNPHRNSTNVFDELKTRGLDLNSMKLNDLDTIYMPKSTQEVQDILDTLLSQNKAPTVVEERQVSVVGGTEPVEEFKLESLGISAPPQE